MYKEKIKLSYTKFKKKKSLVDLIKDFFEQLVFANALNIYYYLTLHIPVLIYFILSIFDSKLLVHFVYLYRIYSNFLKIIEFCRI